MISFTSKRIYMRYIIIICCLLSLTAFSCSGQTDKVYVSVEQMPQYPGGDTEMMKYLMSNITYPIADTEEGLNSRIIARFIVTSEGKIRNVEVIRPFQKEFDARVIQIIESIPDWIPGKQNGKAVDCYYTLPMTICFQK